MNTIIRSVALSGEGSCVQRLSCMLLRHASAQLHGGAGGIHGSVNGAWAIRDS
ncbi:hypothetical protein [Stenotrophomonas maltophilia]|uniref:hypothetical protein n=1 Tax=Stenotrophomonas maltophilia TaxID=40324 RepID=UPI0039C43FB3